MQKIAGEGSCEQGESIGKSAKSTILYVDDEADIVDLMNYEFESAGYRVLTALGGNDAQELLRTHKVEAVVSDARMPRGDGFALLRVVKEYQPSLPFILMLTEAAYEEEVTAYHEGADSIFSKPFSFEEILARLEQLLDPRLHFQRLGTAVGKRIDLPIELILPPQGMVAADRSFALGRGGFFLAAEGPFPNRRDEASFRIVSVGIVIEGLAVCRWRRTEANKTSRGMGFEIIEMDAASRLSFERLLHMNPVTAYIPRSAEG